MENRFTKCDICSIIKSEKEKTMDPTKIVQLSELIIIIIIIIHVHVIYT